VLVYSIGSSTCLRALALALADQCVESIGEYEREVEGQDRRGRRE
jgi:hypothetical protein